MLSAETRSPLAGSHPTGWPSKPYLPPAGYGGLYKLLCRAAVGGADLVEGLGVPRRLVRLLGLDLDEAVEQLQMARIYCLTAISTEPNVKLFAPY